ncbi:hypothetical protein TNCV_3691391 [Trichonephila clavipes]|nr:hypothetical protein TNCV_3691391 [Trichonephila clavipes]
MMYLWVHCLLPGVGNASPFFGGVRGTPRNSSACKQQQGRNEVSDWLDARHSTLVRLGVNEPLDSEASLLVLYEGILKPNIPVKISKFQIFQLIHGLAHPGIKSTVKLMTEKYVWSDIKKQVREWAKVCIRCQKCKVSRHTKSKLGEFEQPDERFSVVHIDLIGKLPPSEGMQYCLTCIDRFSCWMEAIPIPEITAEIVGRAFYEKWICRFGVPAKLVTDQGRQFEAELFRSIAAIWGDKVAHTTPYHPQCNGKVERLLRTLKGAIKAHNNIRWTESLHCVVRFKSCHKT